MEVVRHADPRVPLSEVRPQVADINRTINQEITFARLCSAFAMLALVIACVGLYGAVAYNVARRTGEIGIRDGARGAAGGIVQMVLREVVVLAAVGLWSRRRTCHFAVRRLFFSTAGSVRRTVEPGLVGRNRKWSALPILGQPTKS